MNPSASSIDQALLEVRKAYRLIHDYQRMVLDAVNHIGKQLGLDYEGGYPKFSDPSPRLGKGALDYWSWDWLNRVLYNFHFTRSLPDENKLSLSILLISDTGYFHSGEESGAEPNGTDFIAPDKSRTEIGFIMSAKLWPYSDFMESNAGMKAFIESRGGIPAEHAAAGVIGKCVSLSRLVSEEGTNELINELVATSNPGTRSPKLPITFT